MEGKQEVSNLISSTRLTIAFEMELFELVGMMKGFKLGFSLFVADFAHLKVQMKMFGTFW